MSTLPQGWLETTLGEVIDYGTTLKVEPEEISDDAWILELEDIERDTSKIVGRFTFGDRQSKSTKNSFTKGDVLYGKLRPYLNKVVIADEDGFCTTEIVPIKGTGVTDNRYVFYWLKGPSFLDYAIKVSHGLHMPRLGTDAGRKAPFVLAPLAEQRRIAAKLDAVLARVDAARARLERVPVLLRRFRQSVFAAATSGELTEEWRRKHGPISAESLLEELARDHVEAGGHSRGNASEPTENVHTLTEDELPPTWKVITLRDVCVPGRPIAYGILKPGPELDEGIPYIRVADFPGNKLSLKAIKKTSKEIDAQYRRSKLRGGDLLLSIRGSVGRLIEIPESLDGANITQDTARLSISPRVLTRYIYFALLSESVQRRMAAAVRGVAVRGINIGDVRALQVPLPSFCEQQEIVRRVESLLTLVDKVQAQYERSREHFDELTSALLAKAFRGALVPQDPSDEPADRLLERIASSRTAPSRQSKPRKLRHERMPRAPRETSTVTKSRQDEDVREQPYLAAHLRRIGVSCTAEVLFRTAELPVVDFYKQLAWEVAQGYVKDNRDTLEPGHAAG